MEYTQFDQAIKCTLAITPGGVVRVSSSFKCTKLNKLAFYRKYDTSPYRSTPADMILSTAVSSHTCISPTSKLYFSSKSTMPRDSVRGTYKIVRSVDKADYIVIPDKTDSINNKSFHLLFTSTLDKSVVLFMVSFTEDTLKTVNIWRNKVPNEIIMNYCVNHAIDRNLIVSNADDMQNEELCCRNLTASFDYENKYAVYSKVYFVPNIPEYVDILTGKDTKLTPYIFDTRLDYETGSKITAEGLYVSRRNTDRRLVLQSLSAMNWRRYPLTISVFLYSYLGPNYISSYDFPNGASFMKDSLKIVTFSSWENWCTRWAENQAYTAEDFNMLQDWLFRELNFTADQGFVDLQFFKKLPVPMQEMFIARLAVKKGHVDKPIDFQSIKQNC